MIPFSVLDKINTEVNNSIRYVRDVGKDHWKTPHETLIDGCGDCEDFAILKAYKLAAMGYSLECMRITCYRVAGGDYHAVLLVESEQEKGFFWRRKVVPCKYVLDNRWNILYTTDEIRDHFCWDVEVSKYVD